VPAGFQDAYFLGAVVLKYSRCQEKFSVWIALALKIQKIRKRIFELNSHGIKYFEV
jgi:hypothetical protein